ncbi:MAG TPA: glycosyltransferase [Gemmataceae bacterium]|nr:glycosyltransferase [Gemmataceae bacterium]
MMPTVSVIIATYNYGRYLADAVESALSQTLGDLEIIVVDDGSTDDTPDVVRPFLHDRRVQYHRLDHCGQPAAKNAGIRRARAPLVAFLDADDLWLPTKLEKQVALSKTNSQAGVVYARRLLIDEQGQPLHYDQPALHRGRVVKPMFRDNFVCFSSALVRRAVFDDVGMFDESLPLAIDYDLWLRVATKYDFDYVDEPLVLYRTGHASLSQRTEERLFIANRIMQRFLKAHGGASSLPRVVVRRARAETCYHIALARRGRSRWRALPWYLLALTWWPTFGPAWHGLASLPLPEAVRRCLRMLLGRPADWAVRSPVPSDGLSSSARRLEVCPPRG